MPIYTFQCPVGHRSDEFKHMEEMPCQIDCPVCGKPATRAFIPGQVQVVSDSSGYPKDLVGLQSIKDDTRGYDTVHSRSEHNAHTRKYNNKMRREGKPQVELA